MPSRKRTTAWLYVLFFVLLGTWSWADDSVSFSEVSTAIGTFEDGVLHNSVEKTYKLPDLGAFVAFYPEHGDLTTGLLVEVYDRSSHRGMLNWLKWDLMFSEQRVGIAAGRKVYPVIDVTVSLVFSRDFRRDEDSLGFAVSLVKF